MEPLRIQQLPAAVANQIAAGEVIERPASVIKELLENALDAGADSIMIEINYGGLNQIKISDNGIGILAADLPLAIAAHATSKISQLNDLYAIKSMGFRGEALASIAAVSRLSIISKPPQQEHAMKLQVDGSSTPQLSPCARSQGTTVDVSDLFFNAPVRKKFLKTARSEYQAIEMVVKRFALSEPSLAITLKHNDKQIFTLPPATCEKTRRWRIQKLLGKPFIENAVYIDVERAGMHLYGWISDETYQRSQNDKQWVYVNQRMMKDKLIHYAIKQAYADRLYPGRYPSCLLYLTIAPLEVDINVHPTKHEVRFQQPRLVHDFISSSLANALSKCEQTTTISTPKIKSKPLEMKEEYIKRPLQAVASLPVTAEINWINLNTRFGLIFLHEKPYLIDLAQAQQQCLLSILSQQTLPLASRPLLVPVNFTIAKNDYKLAELAQKWLMLLGIQLDWMSETGLVVRTIPTLFPQLNIKKLLERIVGFVQAHTAPEKIILLKFLISCQSFDAYLLTHEEKVRLNNYLQQCITFPSQKAPWCLHLDIEKCHEMLESPKDYAI